MKAYGKRSQSRLATAVTAVVILATWVPVPAACQQPIPAATRKAVAAKLEAAASAAGISIDPTTVSMRTSGNSVIALAFRTEHEPLTSSELAKGVKAGIVYVAGDKSFVVSDTKLRLPRQAYIFELVLPQGESIPSVRLVDEKKQTVMTIKGALSDGAGADRSPRARCLPAKANRCPAPSDRIPDAIGFECFIDKSHSVSYAACGDFSD